VSATATPGLWDWTFDPAVVLIVAAAAMYLLGAARTVTPARTASAERLRAGAFYAALATLAIALCSPIDALSEQLFWVHMIQHILLLMVAAPLLVLARPWVRMWRALPLDWRRGLARSLGRDPRTRPLRDLVRLLGTPAVSFALFSVVLLAWHVPALFDATLRYESLHALEHTLFLATAVMFWKQVIPSPPLRARLSAPARALYAVGAMVVSWVLAVVLALAPHPLYAHYAHLAGRPGSLTALTDQQIAAGIMWVPGSIAFVIVIFAYVHRWLIAATPPPGGASRLAGEH
jgi:cytochrome c oxidase assembly factor CtaG